MSHSSGKLPFLDWVVVTSEIVKIAAVCGLLVWLVFFSHLSPFQGQAKGVPSQEYVELDSTPVACRKDAERHKDAALSILIKDLPDMYTEYDVLYGRATRADLDQNRALIASYRDKVDNLDDVCYRHWYTLWLDVMQRALGAAYAELERIETERMAQQPIIAAAPRP